MMTAKNYQADAQLAPQKKKMANKSVSTEVKIFPPFGYRELHALNRDDFVRMHSLGEVPTFAAVNEILPLTYTEFFVASSDYPIVFTQSNGDFMPVVLVGLERGVSLFAQHDGRVWRWDVNNYLPAYVRRHPFCMSTVNGQAGEDDELLVCVDKDYVGNQASEYYVRLFDEDLPTERWGKIEQFLQSYQADIVATAAFTKLLNDFGLFQPVSANLMPDGLEGPLAFDGMFAIDEAKLNTLEDSVLLELHRNGYLPRIYAHLKSLQNFQKLLYRLEAQQFSAQSKLPVFNA
jgi:hypothetical protein